MSLIEEALRRVQDPIAGNKPPASGQTVPKNQSPPTPAAEKTAETAHSWKVDAQPKDSANRSLVLLTASLVTAASVLWILGFLFIKPAYKFKPAVIEAPIESSKAAVASGPEASPALKNTAAADAAENAVKQFKLSGVVIGKGEHYAVIDGRIVSRGESIEGETVIEISESSTVLQRADGTQTVLRVPR